MRLVAVLLVLASCSGGEADLQARLDALRASGALDYEPPLNEAEAATFVAELYALDARLEEVAPVDDAVLTPGWCATVSASEREEMLAATEFFVEGIERLLERPECRRSLASVRGLTRPLGYDTPAIGTEREPKNAPSLMTWRHWTNVLCAHAKTNPVDAPRSFALTLDLAHVVDDGSVVSGIVRFATEGILLEAVADVVEGGRVDTMELRRALDPRLVRSTDPRLGYRRLALGVELQLAALREMCDSDDPDVREAAARRRLPGSFAQRANALLDRFETERPLHEAPCVERRQDDGFGFVWFTEFHHNHEARLRFARVALALAERIQCTGTAPESLLDLADAFEGELPSHPCPDFAFELERDGGRILLRIAARAEGKRDDHLVFRIDA